METTTKQEFMIEVWEQLDCESVGAAELQKIQAAVAERFGDGAVDSPASIARVLANEGAVLRHPELLEFDTTWRESIAADLSELEFKSIPEAIMSMHKLEAARRELARDGREALVTKKALKVKGQAQALTRSKVVGAVEKEVAREVSQWLTIWLNDPELFEDWLSLRTASHDFKQKFGPGD
jgi:hypothetical protein